MARPSTTTGPARRSDKARQGIAERLPPAIFAKLRSLIRRQRLVTLWRGLLATLAVASACAIIIIALDSSFTFFDDTLRTALFVVALLATTATAYFQIWRPLRRPIGLLEVARAVESRHPELEERLSSAVQLLEDDGTNTSTTSAQMLTELARAASVDASSLRPRQEFSARRARGPLLATAASAILIGGTYLIWPSGASRLLTRAVAPFIDSGNAYSDKLTITPGDLTVPEGGTLTIAVELDASPGSGAQLRRRIPGDADAVERMAYVEPTQNASSLRFELTIPAVAEPFEYRIHSGRALSRYFRVEVIPRPRAIAYEIDYEFPDHTQLEPLTLVPPAGLIAAPAGTVARLSATLDRPVKTATLLLDGSPIWQNRQALNIAGQTVVTWEFALLDGVDGSWSIQLEDADGITNKPEDLPLRAIADAAPAVHITLPSDPEISVKPTELIPIGYAASEDYGFSQAQLLIKGHPAIAAPIPEPSPDQGGRWSASTSLDLRDLDLRDTRSLEVRIRVTDNRPGSPAESLSESLTLQIDPDAKSLLDQTLARQHAELHEGLWTAMEKLMSAREIAADQPATLLDADPPATETLLEIKQVASLAGEAESLVVGSARSAESSLFKELAPRLDEIAARQIAQARIAAEAIPLTDRKIGRVHKARTTIRQLEEGIAELGDVLRDLKQGADRARLAAELAGLESRKRQLAKTRDGQTDASGRQRLQEQIDTLESLALELMKRSGESLAQQFGDAGALADELARRAAALAEDQAKLSKLLTLADDLAARENLIVEFIRWLESEQRGIARECSGLTAAGNEASLSMSLATAARLGKAAADALAQNLLVDAARDASQNASALAALHAATPALARRIQKLAAWQNSIAVQLTALGGGDLDSALEEMRDELAEAAATLSAEADRFEQGTRGLADPTSARRTMRATKDIAKAAAEAAAARAESAGERLDEAAAALTSASTSLAAQAGTPMAKKHPDPITPEIARERAAALAAQLANQAPADDAVPSPGWAHSGGDIGTALATEARAEAPAEYRDLVKRYFEEISRRSNTPESSVR